MAGFDSLAPINSLWPGVKPLGTPNFWLRYFYNYYFPSSCITGNPNGECEILWDANSSAGLGPICTPNQADMNGNTTATGQSVAQKFCSAIYSVYITVLPLQLPSNGDLYCWLDQEHGTPMSADFWDGWAAYVDGYEFANTGTLPLYPCLYCEPSDGNPCTAIADADYACFAVWANQHQKCPTGSPALTHVPSWDAEACAAAPTEVWQFATASELSDCGYYYNVDLDVGASGFNTKDYCFYLSAKPT